MIDDNPLSAHDIAALRRELAQAERMLRENAEREGRRLGEIELVEWREAQNACFSFDRMRHGVNTRINAIVAGEGERFLGERKLAEMTLRDANRADASYTIISFARRRDRLRYLRGGSERESVLRESLERGGVYTEQGYFQEILR